METYSFDEAAYERLRQAGITWRSVLDVLHIPPRLRQPIGAVLRVAGQDRDGRWLLVILIEDEASDNAFQIVTARELHDQEAAGIARLLDEGSNR
ncbi:hypothetical protein [Cryptosporangium minutisporangium]|uniref:DUF4258 domain-containing protein n=1 Tax=Cryptosporangium minutisporangium TaxID=113569 RepID=A0ABP6TBJ2_9ACTN